MKSSSGKTVAGGSKVAWRNSSFDGTHVDNVMIAQAAETHTVLPELSKAIMSKVSNPAARCECGELELRIKGAPVVQLVCHCSDCRAFTGLPYSESAFFIADDCSVLGQSHSETLKCATGFKKTHHMCASCETPLYVTVGALNGAFAIMAERLSPFDFKPQAHIWTDEKVDGVSIPPGATQSTGAPPKELVDLMVSSFWRKT